ncbi:MAG TPA: hypothetical protein VGI95_18655 [Caulobacteraceae bacterium]
MANIISQIWNGAITLAEDAERDIEADIARIKTAFPPAATTVDALAAVVKQGASDAIGALDTALAAAAPAVTKQIETAADGALTSATGGLALPLVGLTNAGVEAIENLIVSTANAWALKAKATLAGNNAAAAAPAAS